jgi:cobalamin biosynthetic protein CobC
MSVADILWHGGDLSEARRLFPNALEPWIDLSTGINPVPYPLPTIPASIWQRLPGAANETALLTAARQAYGVPATAGIVAAPGTQILIELLPRLAAPGAPVAVLAPTYGEHARAWRKAGHPVREIDNIGAAGEAPIVVLVNPNNPDGRTVAAEVLIKLAASLALRDGLLIVDEAFADFEPQSTIIPHLPAATLVLRSFGKTYGLAGLRLGFAVGAPDMTARLRDMLGPWAVPGPAAHVGAAALADRDWLGQARKARAADARRLDDLLAKAGRVIGGTSLFRLLEAPAAPQLFDQLGRHGVYIRRFQDQPNRLRFGLPGEDWQWGRLEVALAMRD